MDRGKQFRLNTPVQNAGDRLQKLNLGYLVSIRHTGRAVLAMVSAQNIFGVMIPARCVMAHVYAKKLCQ